MDIVSYLLGKKSSGGGSGGIDWQAIGYPSTPKVIADGYNYALQIQQNWVPAKELRNKFENDKNLLFMPLVDTSITTKMNYMFNGCSSLLSVALLDTKNVTSMNYTFSGCLELVECPSFNTESVTDFSNMFRTCSKLEVIPVFNAPKATSFYSMLLYCPKLNDESLDNLLQTCISASSYTGTKTLYQVGLSSANYPVSRIQALPHYQDFINAGWSIGY